MESNHLHAGLESAALPMSYEGLPEPKPGFLQSSEIVAAMHVVSLIGLAALRFRERLTVVPVEIVPVVVGAHIILSSIRRVALMY